MRRASISEPSDTDPEPRTLDPSPAGESARAQPPGLSPTRSSLLVGRTSLFGGVEHCGDLVILPVSVWGKEKRLLLGSTFRRVFQGTLSLFDVSGSHNERILWPHQFGKSWVKLEYLSRP